MKQLRLAKSIIKMMVKDRFQYPGRLIVDTFGITARCGVLLILYSYIFKIRGGVLNGVTFQIASWSMFIYFVFLTLRLRDLASLIMQDIKSGTVEILLSKPMNYLTYRIWWQFGAGIYPFLVITLFGSLSLWYFVGIPETMNSLFFFTSLVFIFIFSSILTLLIYSIVGLLSFWIEDIKPLYWIVDKAVMILGGSYLPVALFPPLMYQIAIWSPFGASQFITHTVYESWKIDYIKLFSIQFFWIALLGIIVFIMFKSAHKNVSVNGG